MRRVCRALAGAALSIGLQAAWAHPDLLIQIDVLTTQLAETPDDAQLLLKRGDLYRRHEDYTSAARDFDRAAETDPNAPLLAFYRARLQQDTGHPEQAEHLLDTYLAASPGDANAWKLRGEVNLSLNRPARSAEYFDRAISFSSNPSPELFRLLVMARVAVGEDGWASAMSSLEEGLQLFGLEVTLLGLGTDIALASGRPDQAAAFIDRLPSKLADLPQWQVRTALLECFADSPEPACRAQADAKLRRQTEAFMLSYGYPE